MGYGVQEIVCWYQKKIGTYDKQQWEKTVEQRILSGFTHVPKKTAKLKTELIDVDLVRGSSFTKAKPKHGLVTVTRLAVLRLVFLPLYSRWWSQQTSPRVFALLLLLYVLQLFNIALYFYATSSHDEDTTELISVSEVLVPVAMMLGLSVVHSLIVSTHSSVNQGPLSCRMRRTKRTKRRILPLSRPRINVGSNSKSSPDTGSEQAANIGDAKYNKRVRLKNSSSEDVAQNAYSRQHGRKVAAETGEISLKEGNGSVISQRLNIPDPVQNCVEMAGDEVRNNDGTPQDDDGFESLNGNGSSDNNEEEQNSSEGMSTPRHVPSTNCDKVNICDSNKAAATSEFEHKRIDLSVSFNHADSVIGGLKLVTEDDGAPLEAKFRSNWVKDIENFKDQNACSLHKLSAAEADNETDHKDTDSDPSEPRTPVSSQRLLCRRRGSQQTLNVMISNKTGRLAESSYNSSGESEEGEVGSFCPLLTEGTTSAGEWIGITTNSEECSYSSDMEDMPTASEFDHPFAWEFQMSPTVILSPSCAASDKVSCTMWEKRDVKKADLSVLDISSAIIARVEAMPENLDYFYAGMVMSVLLAAVPSLCRLSISASEAMSSSASSQTLVNTSLNYLAFFDLTSSFLSTSLGTLVDTAFGVTLWERCVVIIAMFERSMLASMFFFLLAVAERTFKQRFLYAKFFSHLTSFRRARKSELPHFRLNKVRNIKTWLSVRSYLKKRGPQRSVDMIVSSAFVITLLLLSFLSVELLKDSVRLHAEYNVEALAWCLVLGFFLLRFMTLGTKINSKYHNLSVLITEQINLYLQIEQKPNKKEELMVANSVLKLAADLLKELESPFKISGFAANPYLYTITKVVILSALSGVLSEMLGFKLKLHKIKIK